MPQLVKKRRSGWAVLAAGALVATLFAVVAPPAAVAAPRQADQQAQWTACLGPAKEDAGFTDVAMDVHYEDINCLAYYGITVGKAADKFAPGDHVTRGEMSLFLTRMADAAGVSVDDDADAGFTDLDGLGEEWVDAINRLANAGIMEGRTETTFDPSAYVTRGEMAVHLFGFLDLALDTVYIDEFPTAIDGDGTGWIKINAEADGEEVEGHRVDDYFGDARRLVPFHVDEAISAVYELGVTNGTNGLIGDQGTFEPYGNVTRAQMASFMMRALGHTNLRPVGLTAQSTASDTQVSVRDDDFKPVGDVRTEVFTTNFPDDAFDSGAKCVDRFVTNQQPSFDKCRIDYGDRLTDSENGNALWAGVGIARGNPLVITCTASTQPDGGGMYTFMAGTRGTEADYTVYAWSDSVGEAVDAGTDLFESEPANTIVTTSEAVKAVITGGTSYHVKMGRSVTYTVQLRDAKGNNVGPTPGETNTFEVKVDTFRSPAGTAGATPAATDAAQVTADDSFGTSEAAADALDDNTDFTRVRSFHEPDENGRFEITLRFRDPTRVRNNPDAWVRFDVQAATGNDLYMVDMTMPMGRALPRNATGDEVAGVTTTPVRFSDNPSVVQTVDATAATWRLRSTTNRNSISASLDDQYGELYRRGDHQIQAADTVNTGDFPTSPEDRSRYTVGTSGRRAAGYTHLGTRPLHQTVTLTLQDRADTPTNVQRGGADVTKAVNVYWADRGTTSVDTVGKQILLGDPVSNHIIVDEQARHDTVSDTYPVAYPYGPDDDFVVEDQVVTMDQFEEILSSERTNKAVGANLVWVGFDYNRPNDGATWTITGLTCSAAAAGGD